MGHFNDWIVKNGGMETDEIPVTIVPLSKKPKPSPKIECVFILFLVYVTHFTV